MNPPLSVILPVYNAEQFLTAKVTEVLETVSGLDVGLEVLVVDDGSTDHTLELSDGLAQYYPQIRVLRTGRPGGPIVACRRGMEGAAGRVLLLHSIERAMRTTELDQLWAMRDDPELVAAQYANDAACHRFLRRLLAGGQSAWIDWEDLPSLLLIRRDALDPLGLQAAHRTLQRITRTDLAAAPRQSARLRSSQPQQL